MATVRISLNELKELIKNVIKETVDSGYHTLVGYVKDSNVQYAKGDYYILVETSALDSKDINDILQKMIITSDPNGSSYSVKSYLHKFVDNGNIELLPKYKNTYIEYTIFGYPDDVKQEKSEELISTIRREGSDAILVHNSPKKIEDGMVRIGMPMNRYSKNDFQGFPNPRAYYWGTSGGKDVSNTSAQYEYICKLPISEIYDTQFNPNNYQSYKDILADGYTAFAYYMNGKKTDGTVVVVFKSLPIIKSKSLKGY